MGKITRLIGKCKLKAKRYSPEMCFVLGGVMIIGGVIAAVKATSDSMDKLDHISEKMDTVDQQEEEGKISNEEARKLRWQYRREYAVTLGRNYGLSAALIGGGFTCNFAGYRIQKHRIKDLSIALAGTKAAYDILAEAVKKEYGDAALNKLKYGLHEEQVEVRETTDDGIELAHIENVTDVPGAHKTSPYAIIFDENNEYWSKDPNQRQVFFDNMEIALNHEARRQGYLFLNKAYEYVGARRTAVGNIAGWIFGTNDKNRDGEVRLDIQEIHVPSMKYRCGYEVQYIIDFNVDGNILYDFEKYARN